MAAWSDFLPLVGQHCPNAPSLSIEYWARHAARDFCTRTLVHQAALPVFETDVGEPEYTLNCGQGLEPVKLLACRVDGQRMKLITPAELDAEPSLPSHPAMPQYAYLSGAARLVLHPSPARVMPVSVRAAVRPAKDAAEVEDDLLAMYGQAIAFGAARMLAMTLDGRDEKLAQAMAGLYEQEIGRAKAAAYFNRARSSPRSTPTWC
jgi:hypothetical protein